MEKNGIIGGFRILEEIHSGGQGRAAVQPPKIRRVRTRALP